MRQGMMRRAGRLLAVMVVAVLALAVSAQSKAFAAAPTIEDVELKDANKVEVDFHGDVEYKKVKVIVRNPGGKKYRARVLWKDDEELVFKLKKHKAGKTYRFTIKGVRQAYSGKYGKVKGSITIPRKDIGGKKALSIALKDAGLKKSQVKDIDVDLEKKDDVRVYDVSFESGEYEYEYDIRATDGKILKREKDEED